MINKIGVINDVCITLWGSELSGVIVELDPQMVSEKISVPSEIKFNSNWRIEHKCINCQNTVTFEHDYSNGALSYLVMKNLNSINFNLNFLRIFSELFPEIGLRQVNGAYYLNRLDFNYEYDIQRMSSVMPITYSCTSCTGDYIAIIRISLPLSPDRDIPFGELGRIYVGEIVCIEVEGEKRFVDLIEEHKIEK